MPIAENAWARAAEYMTCSMCGRPLGDKTVDVREPWTGTEYAIAVHEACARDHGLDPAYGEGRRR